MIFISVLTKIIILVATLLLVPIGEGSEFVVSTPYFTGQEVDDWPSNSYCIQGANSIDVNLSRFESKDWIKLVFTAKGSYKNIVPIVLRNTITQQIAWKHSFKNNKVVITSKINASYINVEIVATDNLEVCLAKIIEPLDNTVPDSKVGAKFSIFSVENVPYTQVKNSIKSIVLLELVGNYDGNLTSWNCTGFFITNTIIITNEHCSRNVTPDSIGFAYIDYNSEPINEANKIPIINIVQESRELDYALLMISGENLTKQDRRVKVSNDWPRINERIIVLHHYKGRAKVFSTDEDSNVIENHVYGASRKSDFLHGADTDPRSSGSPIFNVKGEVIGLHHYGFKDNSFYKYNRAVSFSEILKNLKSDTISEMIPF